MLRTIKSSYYRLVWGFYLTTSRRLKQEHRRAFGRAVFLVACSFIINFYWGILIVDWVLNTGLRALYEQNIHLFVILFIVTLVVVPNFFLSQRGLDKTILEFTSGMNERIAEFLSWSILGAPILAFALFVTIKIVSE